MEKLVEWVIQLRQGDDTAFQNIYDALYQKAYYTALKICNYCEADAQDIVQDTFMEVHRSIKNLQNPEYFKTWMIKILISKSSHKFRDNRDMFVEPKKFAQMEGFVEKREYMIPSDKLNNKEEKKILLSLVDKLKPKQKEVLLLQYFEQLSIKEMAEVLEIPEGTVKTRIMYAKEQLRLLVDEYEQKEGRRLGFKADAIGAALTIAFMSECDSMIAKPIQVCAVKPKTTSSFSWLSGVGIAVCSATMLVMGAGIFHELSNPSEQYSEKASFQTVIYRGTAIMNCRDAYYTLKEWAQNPQRMALRDQSEVIEITPVYEALKKYQGVYYEKLIRSEWAAAFEARK